MAKVKRVFVFATLILLLALLWLRVNPPATSVTATTSPRPDPAAPVATAAPAYAALPGSIVPLEVFKTKIVRTELTPEELAAPMPFRVALRMRNLDELRARIAKGEILSQAEMSEKYYPTDENFAQVAAWLSAKGLKVQPADITRLSVTAEGSTANVAQTLQAKFVRVEGIDDKEYISAISAPSIPANFTPFVIGFNGLQPQLKALIRHAQLPSPTPGQPVFVGPQTIAKYYGASSLGLDGTGQTIALIGTENPASSDLTTFWANTGISQSYSNVTLINPWSNTLDGGGTANAELTMDLEWASGMAPGARFRIYQSQDPSQFVPAILNDIQSIPSLKQASYSGGLPEFPTESLVESDSQYYAALAAAGVTFFASSGDWGQYSAPGQSGGGFQTVSYPASDPCVTAVGGTTLQFASTSVPISPDPPIPPELGWGQSGGGTSVNFSRPSWQTGNGVPSGTGRLVPDVSAVASTLTNNVQTSRQLYLVYGGSAGSATGTSVSSPIWAGLCALINQARGNAGLQPVGLLGPRIYPLIGTNAFNDITSDDSLSATYAGATIATTGYDICSGIGTPNIGNLVTALTGTSNPQPSAPVITSQSNDQYVVAGGTATLSVTAMTPNNSAPIFSYQWRITDPTLDWSSGLDNGNSIWIPLSNGTNVSGAGTATLTISNISTQLGGAALDNNGFPRRYDCVVGNQYGYSYSAAVKIVVANPAPTVTTEPVNQVVTTGHNVNFLAEVTGTPPPTFQWQVSTDNGSTWTNLTDGSVYSGTSTSTLAITGATSALNEDEYRYIATNSSGTTTSLAAILTVGPAIFPGPTGVSVDSSGNLYVSDGTNNTIQKVTPALVASVLAGTTGQQGSTDGSGTSALFRQPGGIAIDTSKNLYVADTGNSTIRKITTAGIVTTFAGSSTNQSYQEGTGTSAWFNAPTGIAINSVGNLYIADTANDIIRALTSAAVSSPFAGTAGVKGSTDATGSSASFNHPSGIAVDSSGNLYVADTFNDTIRKITPSGTVTTLAGTPGASGDTDGIGGVALFNQPAGLALDSAGNIYVADTGNGTIRMIAPTGKVSTLAGLATIAGLKDGTGIDAWFNQPKGLAVDSSGNVFVADTGNAAIRKITSAGVVTTLAITAAPTTSTPSTPPASPTAQSSSSGGGGALSFWFLGALSLLATARKFLQNRRGIDSCSS